MNLGAGVQWHDAYDAAHSRNVTIVGGLSVGGSVGAVGGWVQGGGHNPLSPSYGLGMIHLLIFNASLKRSATGVDNVLQFAVVTAKGDHITANSYRNSDIFWALRGGGGGTYGIVTSVTYKTRPSVPIIATSFATIINSIDASPSPVVEKLFTEFIRVSPSLSDAGWGGFAGISPGAVGTSLALQLYLISPTISPTQANDSLAPFFSFAQSLAANSSVEDGGRLEIVTSDVTTFDSFFTWQSTFFQNTGLGQVGFSGETGSRLFSREVIEKDYKKVAQTLLPLPGAGYG